MNTVSVVALGAAPPEALVDPSEAHAFLSDAAVALHRFGTPAHRLEATVQDLADALEVEAQVLSLPTSIFLAVGPRDAQRVTLLRLQPSEHDLGRLARVDGLLADVARGDVGVGEARARLGRLVEGGSPWPVWADRLAWSVSAAGAGVLLGGGPVDLALAAVAGLGVGVLAEGATARPWLDRAFLTLAAAWTALLGRSAAVVLPDVHPGVVALAGIIVLVPGLSFTTALVELATANLVSGMARLAGAGLVLLRLGLGLAVVAHLLPTGSPSTAGFLPAWSVPLAVVVAPVCFAVLLRALPRDLPVALAAALVGWGGTLVGEWCLGGDVKAGVGALALGLAANAWSRWADRPSAIAVVPGVLLLVPGSVGYRSVASLLAGDVVGGMEQAFAMALVAVGISAGLVVAHAAYPARRAL